LIARGGCHNIKDADVVDDNIRSCIVQIIDSNDCRRKSKSEVDRSLCDAVIREPMTQTPEPALDAVAATATERSEKSDERRRIHTLILPSTRSAEET